MRHDTRKIHDENPIITRGLYGGGGGGGGGGDSSGPGIGGAGIGIGAGDVGIGAGIGTGIGGASSVSGAGIGDVGSGIGSGIGAVGSSGGGVSPGTMATLANTVMGSFGLGIPSIGGVIGPGMAIGAAALAGNAINAATGFGGGTPGTGTGDPGSASSPGGGMASYIGNYDQFGNFVPNMANAYGGGYWLQPQSAQEAQDWANNGFNPQAYLAANPDVANDPYYSTRPWEHFYTHGAREGRSASGAAQAPAPAAAPAAAPAGPNANVPDDIRRAQLELVQQQRDIATQMQQRQQALQDQLMAAQGYEPDGAGGYRLNATAQAAQDQQNAIASQLRQRTLDALAGNLPVDPALERGLGEQRRTLEATLRGNLGSGFETSTPGIEALANFDKRAEELRAQQRHDQLTTAEGLRLAGSQVSSTASTQNLANVLGITNAGSVPAGLLSSAAGGLSPIGQNLLGYSALDNAYRIAQLTGQNSQSELAQRLAAQDNAGYGSLVGQLGSAFLRSDYAGDLIKNVGSGLGSLWDSIGGWFG